MINWIADIGANHDCDIRRAKDLIWMASESGATHVKFQHFLADKIVSDIGFELVGKRGHQADWKQSVYDVYKTAELNREWTRTLAEQCKLADVKFMTSPYDIDAVEAVDPFVSTYKIGSGDITHFSLLKHIAKKGKKILLSTGASDMSEVEVAFNEIYRYNHDIVLMQCNTDYTGIKKAGNLNLSVLKNQYGYLTNQLGLSDHTTDIKPVIIAIALGATWIERHFTDDNYRIGPDHGFAMNPYNFSRMVEQGDEAEAMLGDGKKRIEPNEKESAVIQRRAWYATKDLKGGQRIEDGDIVALRPCGADMIPANCIIRHNVLLYDVRKGWPIYYRDIYEQGE